MREKYFIENKKGVKLALVVDRPDKDGKFPGAILLHGFTGHKDEEQYTELAKELLNHNIASVRFDASGFGESGGTLEYDYRFSNFVKDAESVYEWFCNQEFIDQSHIAVEGQSMGGLGTLVLTANHPEIRCLVSISSPNVFYSKGTSEEKDEKIEEWEKNGYMDRESSQFGILRIPYAYFQDAQDFHAVDYAFQIRCPKLIVYGTEDKNVPQFETQQIYDVSPEPKELWVVEGMDHFYKRNPQFLESVTKRVTDFIVKNI